ncbi:hypothetical protein I203_101445 [Kwoniella mangroviensis CBS 8507]|uniref:uncharacterized protein n=1 Tax=Kwoniella mangroviensis CBS 8507 TaxID=1296122 RepID=UPI00302C8190
MAENQSSTAISSTNEGSSQKGTRQTSVGNASDTQAHLNSPTSTRSDLPSLLPLHDKPGVYSSIDALSSGNSTYEGWSSR